MRIVCLQTRINFSPYDSEVPTEMMTTYGIKVDKKIIDDDTDPMLAVVKNDVAM